MSEDDLKSTEPATPVESSKILGIPKDSYVKVTYVLLMISGVISILSIVIGGLAFFGLVGLAGLVLALLGLFVFKDKFNETQNSHFKYIGILFVSFFVLGVLLSGILSGAAAIAIIIAILINLASLALMFAGFRLNEKGEAASKESVINELKSLKP